MSSIDTLAYSASILSQYTKTTSATPQTTSGNSSLTDIMAQSDAQDLKSAQSTSRAASRNMRSYASAGITSDIGKAALNRALSEMQGKVEGAITFDKIYEYQQYLETKFTVDMKIEMTKQGVDPEQEFTISINSEGAISVECDDAETKQAVLDYLNSNPDVCEDFGYIQALGNLKRAQQSSAWPGLRSVKSELVASAVEAMFDETLSSGAMDFAALTAKFNGSSETGSVQFHTGLNYKV